jgi:hypothetical protein
LFPGWNIEWGQTPIRQFFGYFAAITVIALVCFLFRGNRDVSRVDNNIIDAELNQFPMSPKTAKSSLIDTIIVSMRVVFVQKVV